MFNLVIVLHHFSNTKILLYVVSAKYLTIFDKKCGSVFLFSLTRTMFMKKVLLKTENVLQSGRIVKRVGD